jgi:hypothetical protein
MILKAVVDDQILTLSVPEAFIAQAAGFYDRMDRDMDQGWQMSREWVKRPDKLQRCQIVANKLLTALENEDERMGRLMAGYILNRAPEIDTVEIDTAGEMDQTRFTFQETAPSSPQTVAEPTAATTRMQAMEQAAREVTQVFKVGKGWRFSTYNGADGSWGDSPVFSSQQEAEAERDRAFKRRFDALAGQAAGDRGA